MEQMRVFIKLPDYFKTHKHEGLCDLTKSPYAYACGLEGLTYYESISHDPDRFNMFNMTLTQIVPVLGMFPFSSMKQQVEAETDRPFIVDICGGRGQSLVRIQEEAPNGFGAKMILQERKDVLDSLSPDDIPGIEKMEYDFFTSQPVHSTPLFSVSSPLLSCLPPILKITDPQTHTSTSCAASCATSMNPSASKSFRTSYQPWDPPPAS
jgi:hypothetical protein